MDNSTKKYSIYSQMNTDKFLEFIIDLFDNMGMNKEGHELQLPVNCSQCPFFDACQDYPDDNITCLEFLATKLK